MEQEQATASVTTREVGIRYGLISAIIGIFYFVGLNMAGVSQQGPAGWIMYPVIAVIIFLAHKYYKENGDGFMAYGQGISIALWIGLVSSVISSIFTFIYVSFIDATFIENLKDMQIQKMQEQGMSDAQIEQAMGFASMFMSPGAIFVMGLIGGILTTIVVALIVTIFTQKKDPQATI